jgi:hypothetical protein
LGAPATLAAEMRKAVDNNVDFSVGGEYWIHPLLAFRLGYRFNNDLGPGITAGVGLKIKMVEFACAIEPMGDMGTTYRAGMSVRFGVPVAPVAPTTPGEKKYNYNYAPSVQNLLINKAIQRAKFLVDKKQYLDALLELNRALELDPTDPEATQMLDQIQNILKQIEVPQKP